MRRINEILAVVILSLMAVLVAAVGMRLYDTYVINKKMELEIRQQEEVRSRNREAHDRVQEMRREIEELSGDRDRLGQFLEEIRMDLGEAIPVTSMMGVDTGGMSGNRERSEEPGMSAFEDAASISGNRISMSDNTMSVSDNADSVSDNQMISDHTRSETVSDNEIISAHASSISGNGTISGNAASISGNGTISGNAASISGNGTISGNSAVSENTTISGNGTLSGNMLDLLPKLEMISPAVTLAQRRQIRSSLEETLLVNWEDQACLEERCVDFSGKKIACLGDSITAAANLEGEAGYLSYSYPSVLKELLGAEEVYNLGIGGSSIGRYWSDAFVERYKQIPEDTDIIIVMGGTNDGFCLSEKEFGNFTERRPWTFCGDLDELMRGLKENYPDADIFFVTPLPNILQDYLMRERTYLLPQKNVADVILTLSAAYDFRVIDLYNSNILDSHDADVVADYMPDGVHANKAGYRILAEHIAAELVRYYEQAVCS